MKYLNLSIGVVEVTTSILKSISFPFLWRLKFPTAFVDRKWQSWMVVSMRTMNIFKNLPLFLILSKFNRSLILINWNTFFIIAYYQAQSNPTNYQFYKKLPLAAMKPPFKSHTPKHMCTQHLAIEASLHCCHFSVNKSRYILAWKRSWHRWVHTKDAFKRLCSFISSHQLKSLVMCGDVQQFKYLRNKS